MENKIIDNQIIESNITNYKQITGLIAPELKIYTLSEVFNILKNINCDNFIKITFILFWYKSNYDHREFNNDVCSYIKPIYKDEYYYKLIKSNLIYEVCPRYKFNEQLLDIFHELHNINNVCFRKVALKNLILINHNSNFLLNRNFDFYKGRNLLFNYIINNRISTKISSLIKLLIELKPVIRNNTRIGYAKECQTSVHRLKKYGIETIIKK